MDTEPQFLTAADGSRLVVIPEAEYERLLAGGDDETDARVGKAILANIQREGTMPSGVLDIILDRGVSAVRAWRFHRKLSIADLAQAAGLSQAFISKIERGKVYGTRETRRKLANALDAPLWTLDDA